MQNRSAVYCAALSLATLKEANLDPERRLELIAMLARDEAWDAVVLIGEELLDCHYPADIFTGTSGDSGPEYVVALRNALKQIAE